MISSSSSVSVRDFRRGKKHLLRFAGLRIEASGAKGRKNSPSSVSREHIAVKEKGERIRPYAPWGLEPTEDAFDCASFPACE
jgi:hypothetical protein